MPLPVLKNTNSSAAPASIAPEVTIWVGDNNSSYTNGRNWTESAPSGGATVYIVNSSVDITGTDASTTSLKEFRVGRSYTGNIGTATSPLEVMAERLVIDNTKASIHIRGSFRDVHILSGSSQVKVGGDGTKKLDRLMYHDTSGESFEVFKGQCNRLIVGGTSTKVTVPGGMTNDNPLATVAGLNEIRCYEGCSVVSTSGVNDLNAAGDVEITGSGNIFNARLIGDARLKAATSGKIDGKLTMFGGTLDVRNASTGSSFVVDNADLFDGRIFTLIDEQDLTFTNNANIFGPVLFELRAGSTVAVS